MKEPASLFKALADETRLQMLFLIIQNRELCVCDLEHVLEITQSKASRHLRYLLNSGLVTDRRNKVWIYYRVADNLDPAKQAILNSVAGLLDAEMRDNLQRKLEDWYRQKLCGSHRGKPVFQHLEDQIES
jgi:ArsR family transcriptional regulator, arsenate/arsenite/antimonite-responsive transcriptional repressor